MIGREERAEQAIVTCGVGDRGNCVFVFMVSRNREIVGFYGWSLGLGMIGGEGCGVLRRWRKLGVGVWKWDG